MAFNTSQEYLTDLRIRYNLYKTAETAIINGAQEYTIGDRTLRRADLKIISEEIRRLVQEIGKVEQQIADGTSGVRVQRVIPRYDS